MKCFRKRSNNARRNHERNRSTQALDDVLREERKVLTQAQEQVNAINAKREQAMQDLRQAIANEPRGNKRQAPQ